tara:strand:+ start:5147 stop:6232 length:1086 start_codon:yes stop_codon:yes gene_type:complete
MNKLILIICTSLNLGGSEKQAVWLANKLSEKNFDVCYISLKEPGILSDKINPTVTVKNLKIARERKKFFKIVKFFKGVFELRKLVKDKNDTVIISFLFHANLVGKLVKVFSSQNIKHIIAFRSDRLSKRDSQVNKMRTFIFKKLVIDKKTLVVFNSNSGFEKMKLKKPEQTIIYNTPLNLPIELTMNSEIAYVGRLDKLKNLTNLVTAMSLMPSSSSTKLHIYGSGPEKDALENLVRYKQLGSKIIFKGIDELISNKLQSYKAVILTSTHEAFPNILIETMNSKRISISTKVGDSEMLLTDNRGILINGFSPNSIKDAILTLEQLSSNDLEIIQQNAKNFIDRNLNEDVIFNQWMNSIDLN